MTEFQREIASLSEQSDEFRSIEMAHKKQLTQAFMTMMNAYGTAHLNLHCFHGTIKSHIACTSTGIQIVPVFSFRSWKKQPTASSMIRSWNKNFST